MERLVLCVETNNYEEFVNILKNGNPEINIDQRDNNGKTLLMYASEYGNLKIMSYLLNKNANVHVKSRLNMTCMHFSLLQCNENSKLVVELLMEFTADCLTPCINGSPLVMAVKLGLIDCVLKMLDFYPNALNAEPLLYHAIDNRHFKLVNLLLEFKNLNVNLKGGPRRQTPLHSATINGDYDMMLLLLKISDVNQEDESGKNVLHLSAERGLTNVIGKILEFGLDVNKSDKTLWKLTALHQASQRGYVQIVEELIDNGANVDVEDRDKRTPLSLAIIAAQPLTSLRLIQEGCNVNVQVPGNIMNISNEPVYILELAIAIKNEAIIALLQASGAKSKEKMIPKLEILAAKKIRQLLKPKVRQKVYQLPVPEVIQRSLLFYDVDTNFQSIEYPVWKNDYD